jgi:hypothetical protein
MVRLRRFYRDANHCPPKSNEQALDWALSPELWAEHQIRYRNWSWSVTEATVRNCRELSNRIKNAAAEKSLTPQQLVASYPFPASPDLEVEA